MKKLLFLVILCLSFAAYGQQDYKFNNYMFVPMAFNPGYAGAKDLISATALYRTQWNKVGSQFPANFANPGSQNATGGMNTTLLNIHAPIKKLHGGVGLSIINDDISAAFQKFTGFSVTYAYRREMLGGSLGIGLSAGALQGNDTYPYNPLDPDPALAGLNGSAFALDMGFGAHFATDKFYLGVSSSHINGPSFKFPGASSRGYTLDRHYYFTGGYSYPINELITLQPSFLIRSANFATSQADLNLNALLKERFWVGATYSTRHSVVALLGANLNTQLRFGYSYDFQTSQIKNFNPGPIHELWVSYDFQLKKPKKPVIIIKSPRFL